MPAARLGGTAPKPMAGETHGPAPLGHDPVPAAPAAAVSLSRTQAHTDRQVLTGILFVLFGIRPSHGQDVYWNCSAK